MSPGARAPVSATRAFACGSAGGAHASHDVGVQASSRMHSLYQFVSDLFPPSVENACSHLAAMGAPVGLNARSQSAEICERPGFIIQV